MKKTKTLLKFTRDILTCVYTWNICLVEYSNIHRVQKGAADFLGLY